MARIEIDPNYSSPTFSRATAGTDLFKKEDVQALAAAMSTHDHSTGKGVLLPATAIPNGTITSAHIAEGTIIAGDLADGAVTTPKLADASVTQAKLGANVTLPVSTNLLTNGGFEIWQRGNGPFTAGFSADRWQVDHGGGGNTMSVSKDTTNIDTGSQTAAAATATIASGTQPLLYQPLMATDGHQLRGRLLTFSVRVRTSTPNAVRPQIYNGGAISTQGAFHSGDGTWQTLSVSTTMDAAATGCYVYVRFDAAATAYIDNAMLVVGSVPAEYAPLHPADDLARCQRYYEAVTAVQLTTGTVTSSGQAEYVFPYKLTKAVTPTVTLAAASNFTIRTSAGSVTATGVSANTPSLGTCGINANQTGLPAGQGALFQSNGAEGVIRIEANP